MNENETNDVDTPASIPKSQPQKSRQMPGTQLAAYRHAQGRSVEEIANLLKLTPRQILALEADDYALWPALAIVRGFIRAYAKILKVDPAPLIAMVAPEPVEPVTPMASPRTLSMPLLELRRLPSLFINRRHTSLRLVLGALLLFLATVFLVQQGMTGVAHTFESAVTKVTNFNKEWISFVSSALASPFTSSLSANPSEGEGAMKIEESFNNVASGTVEAVSAPSPSVVSAAAVANVTGVTSASESLQLAPADVLVSLNKNVVHSEISSKKFLESFSDNLLVLKVREDSWIEIRKMNRSGTVVSRLFKAGTSETFTIDEPMFMVVGNPTGVEASLRGVPLEMKRASNSKIARLNLK